MVNAMSWRLDELFPEIFDPEAASQQVHAVAFDSRKVTGDDVFVALAGARTDGERFILDAVGHEAVAVVSGGPRPAD
ncbi:MAG: UDP-N-acetylmuramoyl-L-alanyl-D-glutamate--2,6-diaminopimelate ligase, partial [Bosea sp.]|nr:UDP-N-acetylmuramoyl-L-alanyl-D-glutamate--2,6-diaminopimelate ligase [Bosea sp. (in: a-proteobacteria)]